MVGGGERGNRGGAGLGWDPASNLYWAPFRSYSPESGPWLARDPLGFVDGLNLYSYAGRNPVNFSDPFGLQRMIDPEDPPDSIIDGLGCGGASGEGEGDAGEVGGVVPMPGGGSEGSSTAESPKRNRTSSA